MRRGREPASRVNPAEVVRHIERLRADGWTLSAIAVAAGVHPSTLTRLVHGHLAHCSRITGRLVMSVGR